MEAKNNFATDAKLQVSDVPLIMEDLRLFKVADFREVLEHLEKNHPEVYRSVADHVRKQIKRRR